jgi:hypothetical protein
MTETTVLPDDEYMHEATHHPQFNESAYYHFFNATEDTYLLVRIGNRVNSGHAEVTLLIFLPDGKAAFRFARVPIDNNDAFNADGLRFDVIEPLKRTRVRYSGPIHILDSSLDLEKPMKEFTKGEVRQLDFDLSYTALTDAYSGVNTEPGSEDLAALSSSMAVGHYRVPNKATGVFGFNGESRQVNGHGFRDHSWGPRVWNNNDYWRWISGIADDDNWFEALIMKIEGRRLPTFGAVSLGGKVEFVNDFELASRYGPAPHYPEQFTLVFHHPDRDLSISANRVRVAPLRHRRGDELGRIAQVIFKGELDGAVTYGFSEYQDRIDNGVPAGMSEA